MVVSLSVLGFESVRDEDSFGVFQLHVFVWRGNEGDGVGKEACTPAAVYTYFFLAPPTRFPAGGEGDLPLALDPPPAPEAGFAADASN